VLLELAHDLDEVLDAAAEAVQQPHNDAVAGTGLVEQVVQRRPDSSLPLARSTNMRSQPAAWRASSCSASSCCVVLTRA